MDQLSQLQAALTGGPGAPLTAKAVLFSLLAAFLLGQVVAAAYVWTYRGMSYTRSYVHAIAIGSVVACMLMLATGNNIAAGIGIAGSLSVLRLRIALRDPKDMVFIFAGMGVGIACGLHAIIVALIGTAVFCLAAIALLTVDFGEKAVFEGLVRFYGPVGATTETAVSSVFRKHAEQFALTTMREVKQGSAMEYAYQLRAKQSEARAALINDLRAIPGVEGVSMHYQSAAQEL